MNDGARELRRILAVDDDPAIRDLLRLLLEDAGYTVTTAGSVAEALRLVAAVRPDLVICDLHLPDAHPVALPDVFAADPATAAIPLFVCSGAVRELEALRTRLAPGRVAVLAKPFDLDDLLAVVARLLAAAVD